MLNNEILQLPKIDLHCHLDGSLPLKSICELLKRDVKAHQLQAGEHCGNLAEYLEKFELPLSCMQTKEGIKKARSGISKCALPRCCPSTKPLTAEM